MFGTSQAFKKTHTLIKKAVPAVLGWCMLHYKQRQFCLITAQFLHTYITV